MLTRRGLELLIDVIGEILAFATIILIAVMYANGKFGFIKDADLVHNLTLFREIAIVGVISLKGFEFTLKRGFILTIIFGAIVLFVTVFLFFPESLPTWLASALPLF